MDLWRKILLPYYRFRNYRRSISFYRRFIKKGDLIFDIGANIGRRSKIFLQLGAKIIALEPQTSCMLALTKLKKKFPKLTILQKAVGSESGKKELFISNESEVSTFSKEFIDQYKYQMFLYWDKFEEVEITTLDELILEHGVPVYCKIDVENYEYEVLKNLHTPIFLISFEFNYPLLDTAIKCIESLNRLGFYKFNYVAFEKMKFENEIWADGKSFIEKIENIDPKVLTGEIYASLVKV